MARVELWLHEYVRVSSRSASMAVPSRFTVEPSATVWSSPALTAGGLLALSVMVTSTVSETDAVPSETDRVNSTAVSSGTLGAANDGIEYRAAVGERYGEGGVVAPRVRQGVLEVRVHGGAVKVHGGALGHCLVISGVDGRWAVGAVGDGDIDGVRD